MGTPTSKKRIPPNLSHYQFIERRGTWRTLRFRGRINVRHSWLGERELHAGYWGVGIATIRFKKELGHIIARSKQFRAIFEVERSWISRVKYRRLTFIKTLSWNTRLSELCHHDVRSYNSRVILIESNQVITLCSLPSLALRIPLSGLGADLGPKDRIFRCMATIPEKRSHWLVK